MPSITKMVSLILKDIRIKAVNLVCIWTGLVAGSIVLSLITPDRLGIIPLFIFPLMISSFLALFYMEWLISEEKETGTFLLLRTLPISDRMIVSSKIATLAILLSAHALALLPSALVNPVNLLVFLITGIAMAGLLCGCIWGMLVFMILKGANKFVIPLFAILLLSILALLILRQFSWLPGFLTAIPVSLPAVCLSSALFAVLGWYLTCRYFESRDSSQLID